MRQHGKTGQCTHVSRSTRASTTVAWSRRANAAQISPQDASALGLPRNAGSKLARTHTRVGRTPVTRTRVAPHRSLAMAVVGGKVGGEGEADGSPAIRRQLYPAEAEQTARRGRAGDRGIERRVRAAVAVAVATAEGLRGHLCTQGRVGCEFESGAGSSASSQPPARPEPSIESSDGRTGAQGPPRGGGWHGPHTDDRKKGPRGGKAGGRGWAGGRSAGEDMGRRGVMEECVTSEGVKDGAMRTSSRLAKMGCRA